MYVDGASNDRGSGVGVVLLSPNGVVHENSLSISFSTSNNEAEYKTLIVGLKIAEGMGILKLVIYSDSQFVVNYFTSDYEARDERMKTYLDTGLALTKKLQEIRIEHIPREQNVHVDALVGLASGTRSISFGTIYRPSFELGPIAREVMNIDSGPSWMDEIWAYLKDDMLHNDKK